MAKKKSPIDYYWAETDLFLTFKGKTIA